jgi:hypothetical protein
MHWKAVFLFLLLLLLFKNLLKNILEKYFKEFLDVAKVAIIYRNM